MRRLRFGIAAVVLCLAQTLVGWQAVRADENAIGEKLLPKETLLFFTIPDVSEMKGQ